MELHMLEWVLITNYPSDFYGYESTSNSWNRIADYPTTAAVKYSTSFSIGAFGFTFLNWFRYHLLTLMGMEVYSQLPGDYRSAQTGAWVIFHHGKYLMAWAGFRQPYSNNADGTITIRNGHTINFDNDVIDADELIVRAGATFMVLRYIACAWRTWNWFSMRWNI